MNGGRCSTTRIWRPPSSTASWSADGSFASMDPRDELVISSWRTPCQAVPNGSEYLEYVAQNFRNPQKRGKPYYERNQLRRKLWLTRPGDSRFGWHSLRHTFSTYGGNSGVPLPVLQYPLGHASMETTMLYTHPLLEAERNAVERIASILLPIAPTMATRLSGGKSVIQ